MFPTSDLTNQDVRMESHDLIAPLKFTAKLACVQVLLDLVGDQSHVEGEGHKEAARKLLRQLETGCYTAVSDKLLKRFVLMYPEKLTNQMLVAMVPSHKRDLTLKNCEGLSSEGLKTVVSRCHNLNRIDLAGCQQFSHPTFYTMLTHYRPNMTVVSLEGCDNLSDASVKILLLNLKTLKHLNLSNCNSLTDKVFLVDKENQIEKECKLNVAEGQGDDYVCSLVSIDISCTELSSEAVRHLTTLTGPTLRNVDISAVPKMDTLALVYLSGYGISAVAKLALASPESLDLELINSLQELQKTLLQLKERNRSLDIPTDDDETHSCNSEEMEIKSVDDVIKDANNMKIDGTVKFDDTVHINSKESPDKISNGTFNNVDLDPPRSNGYSNVETSVEWESNFEKISETKDESKEETKDESHVQSNSLIDKSIRAPEKEFDEEKTMHNIDRLKLECSGLDGENLCVEGTCVDYSNNECCRQMPVNCQSNASQNTPHVFQFPAQQNSCDSNLSDFSFAKYSESTTNQSQSKDCHFSSTSPLNSENGQTYDSSCHTTSRTQNVNDSVIGPSDDCQEETSKTENEVLVCKAVGSDPETVGVEHHLLNYECNKPNVDLMSSPDSGVCLVHDRNPSEPVGAFVSPNIEIPNKRTCETTTHDSSLCDKSSILTNQDSSVHTESSILTNHNPHVCEHAGQNDLSVCDRSAVLTKQDSQNCEDSVPKNLSEHDRPSFLANQNHDNMLRFGKECWLSNQGSDTTNKENEMVFQSFAVTNEKGTFKSDCGIILSNHSQEIRKSFDIEDSSENEVCLKPTNTKKRKTEGKFYQSNIVSLTLENPRCENAYGINNFICLTIFAKENRGLKKLALSGTNVLNNYSLWKLSKKWPLLQELSLGDCEKLTYEGISSLGKHCKSLSVLNLQGVNFIGDPEIFCILKNKKLEFLNLAESAITDKTLKAIAEYNMEKLRALDLSWCDDVTEVGLNYMCSRRSDTLYKLSFRQLPVSNMTLDLIATNLQQLKIINLSSVGGVEDPALINLFKHLPLLEYVDISWNSAITNDTIFALMRHCPRLQVAILSGLKRLTSAPFLPLISDIRQWRRCQALLQFKLRERKVQDNVDLGSSSDEEYSDLYFPHRSSVYWQDLKTLNLEYCDQVRDRDLNEISFICRQSLIIINYFNEVVKPELAYNTCWYSNYLDL